MNKELLVQSASNAAAEQVSRISRIAHFARRTTQRGIAVAGVVAGFSALASPAIAQADYDPKNTQKHPGALGAQTLAVVLANFENNPIEPFTAEEMKARTFSSAPDSLSSSFSTSSFGKLAITGKVYDWVTLPSSLSGSCDAKVLAKIGTAAKKAAEVSTGENLRDFDKYMFVLPRQTNKKCINENNGNIVNGTALGNATFLNSRNNRINTGIDMHELGHSFGLSHTSTAHCFDDNNRRIALPLDFDANCFPYAYGDPFDPMGKSVRVSPGPPLDFNGLNKARMGWIGPNKIKTVTSDQKITVAPVEDPLGNTQLVRIPVADYYDEKRYLYVDFRQQIGLDAKVSQSAPMFNGVTLRAAGPIGRNRSISFGDYSYLVDTTPKTVTSEDAPLAVGKTFQDKATGISIKTLSVGRNGAEISVSFAK